MLELLKLVSWRNRNGIATFLNFFAVEVVSFFTRQPPEHGIFFFFISDILLLGQGEWTNIWSQYPAAYSTIIFQHINATTTSCQTFFFIAKIRYSIIWFGKQFGVNDRVQIYNGCKAFGKFIAQFVRTHKENFAEIFKVNW